MASVPSQYVGLVNNAAAQLGIPASVVAAQIQLESGWNPNAVSPTGAQGLAQFEPGTWASYGSGSPFDPTNAFNAYVRYMGTLLRQEGNLRNALAAYNAGPGNLGAGQGYASTILANAGASGSISGSPGMVSGPVSASGGTISGGPGATAPPPTDDTCVLSFPLAGCMLNKSQARALIGGLVIGGGGVLLMIGVFTVLQYGLGSKAPDFMKHPIEKAAKVATMAAVIPK